MRNFQDKRGFKAILHSKPALMLLGIIVLIFSWSIVKLAVKAEETAKNRKIAEGKIAELEQEREKLSSDIEKLQTDQGKEEAIREKFGFGKPGEGLVVVVEDKNQQEAEKESQSNGFFSFFRNLFK